ncbi:ribonuclease D [Psychrobacter sp. YP14]|uniref:Ribonuclease D n=2 Tax=Psychrobacter TaxID=497 RepID=A0A844M0X5_9GAMM|nr:MULTISPECIES: HRDC domain-containing protein [Psychrobacter]AWT49462.1 ribonuclease D [Psychrobacter sp. YP14]MUG32258.1 ribonuclease D [Psychrobacter sanguinis]
MTQVASETTAAKAQSTDKKIASIYDSSKLLDVEAIARERQASADLPVHWVADFDALEACLDDLETCDRVALDTEFIKRNTYFPILALVQINTGKAIYLIDAPKLDLTEFWVVLEEMPLMIWHACGEDLGIFYLLSESPALTNVFDTQIALSYLTGQLQMGYQQALSQELDVHVEKAESQSDWLARPLSHEQENYAIDDVRYLLNLYDILQQQLSKQGLTDKVVEDCQLYAKELYESANIEDDATYLAMADFRYTPEQLAVLQAVSSWREALARATNQPKTFVLKKQAVRDLVVEMPTSIKQLTQKTTMHRSIVRLYGDELIQVINQAKALSPEEQPPRIFPPYRSKDKSVSKAVDQVIKQYEEQTGVPANVLMRKKWLSSLYEIVAYDLPLEQLPEGLKGWRNEWVMSTLIPLITSHKEALKAGMSMQEDD